ncbi:MAG: hypothetical protein ACI97B_001232 [Verrucomicrobiales bacterium]|jgi:uncharacterized protein (TIRG00374 family)
MAAIECQHSREYNLNCEQIGVVALPFSPISPWVLGMKRGTWLKWMISLIFVGLIIWKVPWLDLSDALAGIQAPWVAVSLGVSMVMVLVSCGKWSLLLKAQGTPVPFGFLLKQYLIGYYFSNLLPSNVGGDVVRSWSVGRRINSQSHAAVSVFLERFTGFICLLVTAVLCPLLVPGLITQLAVFIPILVAAALLLGFIVLLVIPHPVALARKVVPLKFLAGFYRGVEAFHVKLLNALKTLRARPAVWLPVVLLTLIFYALTWLNVYTSLLAFGVQAPFVHVMALTAIVMIVAAIPISLGGLGLAEAGYVFYFSLVAIPAPPILAMALLIRLKLILVGSLGMVLHLGTRDEERYHGGA